ncbi:MAG: tripartite tricarboxylate transporter substrate binding protein [Rhodoplanes sp.]|uniref:Bug family tripartite tricarboxylate transporter substrate binding protein n=1 Tax=Rhodoplanes sp. TaxID=1968906 RepID=UPI0017E0AFF6|nr:tripartite tricarboxylate transporter substrate binding protein [Rhodoplanes sp.]NVO17625.1 tripartite tricarboxylate transporter substrate binding protein [Rhodoplanes sp.]
MHARVSRRASLAFAALLLAAPAAIETAAPALAQTTAPAWPTRPITLVVPFPAGGGNDAMARIVADKLSASLGQQVIVDNRGGGGGNIGTRAVARAQPDGYTLLLGHTGTISVNPSLFASAGYDPRKDFAPIGLMASMPVALLANPSFPGKTIADVIRAAKQAPGTLGIGTSAVGTGGYMTAELFRASAGVDVTLVPYKGTGPMMNDLVGGHVPVAFGVLAPALGNIEAKTLRVIAVMSRNRFPLLPEVPTADESGLPGFESVLHYGLLAPAGTPQPIISRLNTILQGVVQSDEVKGRIRAEGGEPLTSSPEEYAADIDREEQKWGGLVRRLGLKVD